LVHRGHIFARNKMDSQFVTSKAEDCVEQITRQ
jgi:hypothetical protein